MRLRAMIELLQDLQRNVTRRYGEQFEPDADLISHVNDAVAKGAQEPSIDREHEGHASMPVEVRIHFDFDDETRAGAGTLQGTVLDHTVGAVTEVWCDEPTSDGWEIRDENRLLVAVIPDVQHEREADARSIARAAGVGERRGESDGVDASGSS